MIKLKLTRKLRKTILQGNPWVYANAFEVLEDKQSDSKNLYSSNSKPTMKSQSQKAQLAHLIDSKNVPLAAGYYDPHSPIGFRVLSTQYPKLKSGLLKSFIETKARKSLDLRASFLDHEVTNCYRVINGEGDGLPGLTVDRYDQNMIVQFDGRGAEEFWMEYRSVLLDAFEKFEIYLKPRASKKENEPKKLIDLKTDQVVTEKKLIVLENKLQFEVDLVQGQKTGFFLDQRDNRKYLTAFCHNKRVLNLFSYTGGFSLFAGLANPASVTSVDLSKPAIKNAIHNWDLNYSSQKEKHRGLAKDVWSFIDQEKESSTYYDVIIVDPPSMASSEKNRHNGTQKYIEAFSNAIDILSPGGHLFLSSCSSHINFEDFQEIINLTLSRKRKTARILKIAGQAPDHPWPHVCPEFRYLKFVHLVLND